MVAVAIMPAKAKIIMTRNCSERQNSCLRRALFIRGRLAFCGADATPDAPVAPDESDESDESAAKPDTFAADPTTAPKATLAGANPAPLGSLPLAPVALPVALPLAL